MYPSVYTTYAPELKFKVCMRLRPLTLPPPPLPLDFLDLHVTQEVQIKPVADHYSVLRCNVDVGNGGACLHNIKKKTEGVECTQCPCKN